ncbi:MULTISPECIES: ornithine--oxo-acid transaminase [unclassified Nocardioides]|uniref:ornithine--oxo-acid transaminase n=1 Tax=unclassified Nocardioides TaxID=2615069 RepID=UPI0000571542|nr:MULTISPECIES: ornithine--oxo-acid transaminase [unclassified Nocardioides]ABL79445.1 aminotransferase [Nocardioides sp. JS614]
MTLTTSQHIELAQRFAAHNYNPLPVVVTHAQGAWVTDIEGRRYLDCLAGYSALNFGHRHPELIAAACEQMKRLTMTSRAFHNDRMGPFCAALADLTGMDAVLPMNTGAEAVETAIKTARRWGNRVKGVRDGRQRIVVAESNFHGRTTTIVGFSSDDEARDGFGPFTPGFDVVPYGDTGALRAAVGPDTVAVLLEPIQGEAGVIVPPAGYLRDVRAICDGQGVLFIADEIQSGLGRTGTTFACEGEQVVPDVYVLGKALGGGILPVSAIAANRAVLDVITPGSHGSTFGGNPLACAVGHAVVQLLVTGEYQARAQMLGARLLDGLQSLTGDGVLAVRGRGLWVGIDVDPALASGRQLAERLLHLGLLVKDTHGSTVRLSPPLVIKRDEVDWLVDRFALALASLSAKS